MQATITYCLTEAAQRAQMVATGQPVARKQSMTIEVTAEDLPLCRVASDGSISVDLCHSHEPALLAAGWNRSNPVEAITFAPDALADIRRGQQILTDTYGNACAAASQYVLETDTMMMANPEENYHVAIPHTVIPKSAILDLCSRIEKGWNTYGFYSMDLTAAARRALSIRAAAEKAADLSKQDAAITKWLSDPALRLRPTYDGVDITLGGAIITRANPQYRAFFAEIQRRNQADADAAKVTAEAKETLKTAAIDAFVAASGDVLLIQQHKDGLLCRKTVVALMATAALDAAGLPASVRKPEVCAENDCPCVDITIDCIPPEVYARWNSIVGDLDPTFEFRRVRNCYGLQDWDDDEQRASETEYHAVVTIESGPFEFTRRIKL